MPASDLLRPAATAARLAAVAAQGVLALAALAALGACGLAVAGALPWLTLPLAFGDGDPVDAGPWVQGGLALILVALCGFLPASARVMRLEASHRRFHATMEDVARAYYAAHAVDRGGAFRFANEFDAVRERLAFLRDHPELGALEPEVLELAAQMSHVARDLARVYADDKVAAAREALNHRGDLAAQVERDIARATQATRELARRLAAVEEREEGAEAGIAALEAELDALLPKLGLARDGAAADGAEREADAKAPVARPAIAA